MSGKMNWSSEARHCREITRQNSSCGETLSSNVELKGSLGISCLLYERDRSITETQMHRYVLPIPDVTDPTTLQWRYNQSPLFFVSSDADLDRKS
jgi:hypothetical protein